MAEVGIDLSSHTPKSVETYLHEAWDYVITVCGSANATCPAFVGSVGQRLHIGFDDPSDAKGDSAYVTSEFRRVRDEIRKGFFEFYTAQILKKSS